MYHNLYTKVLPALALSFVVFTGSVNADDASTKKMPAKPVAQKKVEPMGLINPPANPPTQDGSGLWVQAEALYLHAAEDNVPYAIKASNDGVGGDNGGLATVSPLTDNTFNGPVKSMHYKWDWGCRAGIGYNLPYDGWDVVANWTYFKTSNTQSTHIPASEISTYYLLPSLEKSALSSTDGAGVAWNNILLASNATAKLHLKINLLDFDLGREFFVSKQMTLRPHVGGRAAWFKRSLSAEFGGIESASVTGTPQDNYWMLGTMNILQDTYFNQFQGGGLFGGLDGEWRLGCGWSFYSQLDLSLLYGTQTSKASEYIMNLDSKGNVVGYLTRYRASYKRTQTRPMTDIALGVRWEDVCCDEAFRIRLQLGWEQHLIFNFTQDARMYTNLVVDKQDLSLSGLSFQARFDF